MSKVIDIAFIKLMSVKIAASKFSASAANGNRIIPSKRRTKVRNTLIEREKNNRKNEKENYRLRELMSDFVGE